MNDRRASHPYPDQPDAFARLTPWLVAACLTAGMGWLVQSADDGHVHVTSRGVERHHHGYVGEHSHDAGDYEHDHGAGEGQDSEPEDENSDAQSGFFAAPSVAQSFPGLPTGLPAPSSVARLAEAAPSSPPARDVDSQARPRAPPAVPVSARQRPCRHSRAA